MSAKLVDGRIKKPCKIDNFLYRHFKQTNHSTSSISIQPVEKITYDDNSTKRYRNIHRHELELNWINYYKHHIHLVLMIILTMKITFLDYLILMFFSLLNIRKRNLGYHGKHKNGNLKRKSKYVFNSFRIKYHLQTFRLTYDPFTFSLFVCLILYVPSTIFQL